MSQRNYLGHAAIFSLTNGLMQVGGLIMLLLYTQLLPPKEYGAYVLLTRLAETVTMLLLVGGFRQAFLTFYQQGGEDQVHYRQRVIVGTYSVFLLVALMGGVLLCFWAGPVWRVLGVNEPGGAFSGVALLQLAFFSVLIDPLCIIPMVLLQVRLESKKYLVILLVRMVVRIALCIFLMLTLGLGVGGALIGTALANLAFAVLMAIRELRQGIAWPDRALIGEMVRFALPFLPTSLCFFVLHDGDRFFLAPWGTEQIGLYEIGYRFAQLVTPFTLVPLMAVWNHRMYEVARTPEAPEVFGRVFTWILSAYLLLALGVMLFVDEAIARAARSSYAGAALFTPLILIGCAFQTMSSLMDSAFYIRRRTDLKLYVTLTATVVMLIGYAILIPWLGALGAAFSTIFGFSFLALATWWTTQRIFPVRYETRRLLAFIGLLVLAWGLGRLIPMGWTTSPLKLLPWLMVPTLAWQLGLISPEEKEYLLRIVKNTLARWIGRRDGMRKMPSIPTTDAA